MMFVLQKYGANGHIRTLSDCKGTTFVSFFQISRFGQCGKKIQAGNFFSVCISMGKGTDREILPGRTKIGVKMRTAVAY